MSESGHERARPGLPVQVEWHRVALGSIGDAVIATDTAARITFMNPIAEDLTGWPFHEASGQSLDAVFHIVNEESRASVENPATRALREGVVVGLANHTLLIAKDGSERPIDDSAAPIRDTAGTVGGVVLVFRDVTDRRDAERRLRESEERFRLLVEGVTDYAIFPLDTRGFISGWNLGAERMKGYAAADIIGKHFSVFYGPDDVAKGKPEHELELATREGRVLDEGWRVRQDGSRFWASVLITSMRDKEGHLRGFTKITRDLTASKLAEDALRSREQQVHLLLKSARDAVIVSDDRGHVVLWNDAATELFGYSEREMLGQPLTAIMPERYRGPHRAGLERLQRGEEPRLVGQMVELTGLRRDGTEFPMELSLSSTGAPEGRMFTGILRDISARKRLEEERAKLDRSVGQAQALQDLNRRKDEFLAILSHELRNPLASIVNAVHLLRDDASADPMQQQARRLIERQVGHLTSMVDDLLEVSRVATGRIRLQPELVDIRVLVQHAVEAVSPLVQKLQHVLAVNVPSQPLWIHADRRRIEQVVVNLLTNAVKYTNPNGRLTVAVERDGAQASVSVTDTGMGIPPDVMPHLFEMFCQAEHSVNRAQGGLGVGLSVAKRLVEMHGGRIEAHSAGPGQGSRFTVRLPLATSAPTAPDEPETFAPPRCHPLSLLVVDDNHDAADSTAVTLRLLGHRVHVAYDATRRWSSRGRRRRMPRSWTWGCRQSTATRPRGGFVPIRDWQARS